ncbi:Stk1 family PASTA domain-containing Ser/Thr kinase [Ruminococcaceae bacterium OttesenSCG-928-I18]|nr:Stk1 family PASTA domain-containing Ser/Thr kinase [Ruminococcaceae bacterium OttesenSCG-928-I18]
MDNPMIGKKLDGRYQLEKLVGEGGMADVYRATDLAQDRTVGVKILKEEFRHNEELVRRFKNESRAISVLNQENIVKVYDVNVTEKMQYIVMEYIEGITLKEYIEQRGEPLTYKETIHFVMQILQALQHAHDKGVVHRDVKPQNIMLMESGTLKVMDFGIARLARSESHTVTDQAIGSVHYISPEQAKGDTTDPRSDIYSVGIMMYEMLSGKLPFESDNAMSVAIAQISDDPVPLLEANPSVPPGLAEITMKAMVKEPRQRYQNALEMMRDIEQFKRDPSIKFEYDYLNTSSPTRYIDKVVNEQKRTSSGKGGRKSSGKGGRRSKAGNGKKKKKRGWLVPITLAVTLAVCGACALVSFNLFANSGNPLFTEYEEIELPNFVGMQYEDVQKLLRQEPYNHLRLEKPNEESNPGVPAGQVISQNPTSSNENPKMVKANQRIYLTVSKGIQDITIPDVSGMSRSEAIKTILDLGLRPYAKAVVDDTVPTGYTIGTDPPVGSVVQNLPDTVITIYVSSARRNYDRVVPSVVGMSTEAAARVLQDSDLQLGPVTEEHNEAAAGTVIGQSPSPNQTQSIGSIVYVTVSLGPEAPAEDPAAGGNVGVPGVVGMSQDAAVGALAGAGLPAQVNTVASDQPAGTVIGQAPSGGEVPAGTAVVLTVSAGPATPAPTPEPEPAPTPAPAA